MIISKYRYEQIRKSINAGENRYRVNGKVSGGNRWPDDPHYYCIDDLQKQQTLHYPVDMVSDKMQKKFDELVDE